MDLFTIIVKPGLSINNYFIHFPCHILFLGSRTHNVLDMKHNFLDIGLKFCNFYISLNHQTGKFLPER